MKTIIKRGLIAIAPLTISIAIIYWLFSFLEGAVGPLVREIIGPKYYYPGMGIVLAIILIFIIGAILNTWIIQKVTHFFERLVEKIPLFKSLYNMIKNVMDLLNTSPDEKKQQVVSVTFGDCELIGFVTRSNFSDIPELGNEKIAVYLPMSYQIGGYTIMIEKSRVKPLDITMDVALQNTLTAWAKSSV
ncbi:MAG: DUF502 domain-containing protein [Simkania sp.]|nr:DUF502 domain-containing protein [Simkania sp.]MCP5489670.1 DUF502 domain-containing protein [Chlamydiales bacterium]